MAWSINAYENVSNLGAVLSLGTSPTVTFGVTGSTITASAAGGVGGGAALSAGTQSVNSGTVVFSNSNGLSFGMSLSSRITASHDGIRSLSAGSTHALAAGVSFADGSGVSFGANGSTVTASVAAGATATGNLGAIAVNAATTYTSGTVVFSNSNGVTFGTNAQTITASVGSIPLIATSVNPVASAASTGTAVRYAPEDHRHAGVAVFAAGSNTGNTAGNTASQVGSWVIAGTNGVTVSGSTGAGGVHTAWLSAGGGGGPAISAAGSSQNAGTIVFSNSNNVTFGMNGSTITASITAAGGAVTAQLWDNIGPANTISGAMGTFAYTASHRSLFVCPLAPYDNGNCFPCDISASTIWMNGSHSGSAATMSSAASSTWRIAVYTRNGQSLSLLNSASFSYGTNAGNANLSNLIAGPRMIPFVSTAWSSDPIFREGSQYWLAWFWSSAGQLNQTGNMFGVGIYSTLQRSGSIGVSQTTGTSQGWMPFYGIYSATTAAFPAFISNPQLNKVSASAGFIPHVVMVATADMSSF